MAKFLRRWWTNIYDLEPKIKIKNEFQLAQHEGMLTDENELLMNGEPVVAFEAGVNGLKGSLFFDLHDKPYELRFNYSMWTGNPRSLLLFQNGRIIAQYGDDSALSALQPIPFKIV